MTRELKAASAATGQKRALSRQSMTVTLALATAGAVMACSSAGKGDDAPSDESTTGGATSAAGVPGVSGEGAGGDARTQEAGAGGDEGSPMTGPITCSPTSDTDEPDEAFTDANCDGVDGDAKRAIFVSPDGFDSDDGSRARPVQSISQGIALAKDGSLALYVCSGTYRENVVIDAPVSIYGGYDCTRDWKRTKDIAVLQSGAGLPLSVKHVAGKVHLERLAFRAPAALGPGQSAQAGAIVDSRDVTLAQVELKAGSAMAGASGTPGTNASSRPPTASASGGSTLLSDCYAPDAGGSPGPYCDGYAPGGFSASKTQVCGGVEVRGGQGGAGGNVWLILGKPLCFKKGSHAGEIGDFGQYRTTGGAWDYVRSADSGARGADGSDGTAAAFGIGSVHDGVYASSNSGSDGAAGHVGWPGSGGPGGLSAGHAGDVCTADYRVGSGGGQGGLGGCGGGAATGGAGGGGSIALVVIDSTVKISNARLSAGDGGAGGSGAPGGAPQPGAPGAAGGNALSTTYQGSSGQPGGDGGGGGDGGPGGGGPSIAILYQGPRPEVVDAFYEMGTPGDGGQAFSGANGPIGATGEIVNLDELLGKKL